MFGRRILVLLGITLGLTAPAWGQNFSVLYDFAGGTADGSGPTGSLIDVGGILYGMTPGGGASGKGTMFSFNPATNQEKVLHSFLAATSDGAEPFGSFIQSTTNGSILYAMTSVAGSEDGGAIVQYDIATKAESLVGSLASPQLFDGHGSLIQSGSTLFGMASNIFSFSLGTNTASLLYAFGGRPDAASGGQGSLTQVGNDLYGMSDAGGAFGHGALFSYSLTSGTETVVHSFSGPPDGAGPDGSLTASGSILYGMTAGGGTGSGTIFSLDTSDNSYQTLFSFGAGDGGNPQGDVLVDGSTLFGMTLGTVFSFNTLNDSYVVLHKFDISDGYEPQGDLLLVGSVLYGMTSQGGVNNDGVIFSITIPEPATVSLISAAATAALLRRPRREAGARHTCERGCPA